MRDDGQKKFLCDSDDTVYIYRETTCESFHFGCQASVYVCVCVAAENFLQFNSIQ